MHVELDTTDRGLEARVRASGADAADRPSYTLTIAPADADGGIEVVAHAEGLLALVGAVLCRLDVGEGLDAVAGGLVGELGPAMARSLGHELLGEADEADRRHQLVVARVGQRR